MGYYNVRVLSKTGPCTYRSVCVWCSTISEVTVLVPGAGLGRLAHEIARRGYSCQGNEFSLFMLFASHFVLNK